MEDLRERLRKGEAALVAAYREQEKSGRCTRCRGPGPVRRYNFGGWNQGFSCLACWKRHPPNGDFLLPWPDPDDPNRYQQPGQSEFGPRR
jgi:hypothetical protein